MGNNQPRSGKFYRRNEEEVMRSLGLKPTIGSGSGWIEKEDGQNEFIIAQLKSTDAQSIRIKLEDLHKLEYNAIVAHKIPAFVIQFLGTNELFVLAKPADLPSIAKYLEVGSCDIVKPIEMAEVASKPVVPKKVVRSGNRNRFWEQKQKEREKGEKEWRNKLKSKQ